MPEGGLEPIFIGGKGASSSEMARLVDKQDAKCRCGDKVCREGCKFGFGGDQGNEGGAFFYPTNFTRKWPTIYITKSTTEKF